MSLLEPLTLTEPLKFSEMRDGRSCECGGKYKHVNTRNNGNGTYDDSYRCDTCGTWCIVTWDKETDQETGRRYE